MENNIGIHLRLLLSKSGRGRSDMEMLGAMYRERTEAQKVAIWFEAQKRDVR